MNGPPSTANQPSIDAVDDHHEPTGEPPTIYVRPTGPPPLRVDLHRSTNLRRTRYVSFPIPFYDSCVFLFYCHLAWKMYIENMNIREGIKFGERSITNLFSLIARDLFFF